MKIKDAINMANLMEQGNVLPKELAILFLSELDGMIQSDIMLHAPEEIVSYDNEEQELLLRPPHDKLYVHYLVMMIRNQQQEYEGYQNTQASVDEKLKTFRRWYVQHYRPADTDSRSYTGGTSADAFGFAYLTAYGLAVKHGYQGTEEEWLESLIGQPGEAARMRYDEDREVIQWGVGNTWYDMFPLSALRDPAVDDIVNKVQAAVDTARGHAHDAGVSSGEASAAATTASSAATAAAQSAQTAGEHADAAKTEAQKASSAANAAGSAVVAAREQADRAEAARTAAEQAEQVAGAAAVAATKGADGAALSARDAETYAGQALSAKSYAEQATFDAKGYAQTAHDAAGAAATLRGDAEYSAQSASKSAQGAEEAADRAEAAAARAEAAGGTGGGGGGGADLTGYATEEWVRQGYQPKGSYLTEDMLDSAIEDALDEAATSGKFDGKNGADGADGKTPVKGVDYYTAADRAEMVQAVVAALPKYAGEVAAV